MKLKLATYNVNNLFCRANVLQLEGFSQVAAEVLADIQTLSTLLENDSYAGNTGTEIVKLLSKYQLDSTKRDKWFSLNESRNKLFTIANGVVKLVAKGRQAWVGWVELKYDIVDEISTENTGRVIQELKPDVLCLVEVESRLALDKFNTNILKKLNAGFAHNLLIDGNDARGIDVGLFSQYPINSVRSHIDDTFNAANQTFKIFSRDCPEYEVLLPNDKTLWMLCNHFKSKGYGNPASNDAKRKRQANRVKDLLQRFDLTTDFVVVAGDFNDTPGREPLKKLLQTPNLFDVLSSPLFQGERWTYQDKKGQIDYLLVSQALFATLQGVGIERRGIFRPDIAHFPEVTDKTTQASDHAAVFAEFNI
ncbi:MAG: endonuclease/exonuclease/phosphatase family protein [Acidobacteria bacterium]|nr:endonuclease/exonuclease/phosphatase family protein [Acidobacteriota bacterium]